VTGEERVARVAVGAEAGDQLRVVEGLVIVGRRDGVERDRDALMPPIIPGASGARAWKVTVPLGATSAVRAR
jgi:hypothetical protein